MMGTVDVERYTGSCLISTAVRGKSKSKAATEIYDNVNRNARMSDDVANPPGLTSDPRNLAGAPLVSIAASIRRGGSKHKNNQRGNVKDHPPWRPGTVVLPHSPAVYYRNAESQNYGQRSPHSLQGAPLIRLPRVGKACGTKTHPHVQVPTLATRAPRGINDMESVDGSSSSVSSDCSSVTSDEGLASAGSDSSLPRLIKPRKRRKKERKLAFVHQLETHKDTDQISIHPESDSDLLANEAIARFLQLNLDSSPDTETPPPLLISFGDSYRPEEIRKEPWGVPSFPSSGGWNSVWGSPSLPTWSDPLVPSRSNAYSWWPESRADKLVAETARNESAIAERVEGSLEVSSQIITSPYGHRDIEIRFFSSVRNSASPGEDK